MSVAIARKVLDDLESKLAAVMERRGKVILETAKVREGRGDRRHW